MEKILIKDNADKAERDVLLLYNLTNELNNEFLSEFTALNIGELTTELLRDCMSTDCKKVEALIRKQAEKDVKTISNVAIKKTILASIEPLINDFKAICSNLRKKCIDGFVELLEVENGKITYIPGAPETIREKAKYYITDPKEIEVYKELKAVSDAYNRLLSIVGEKGKMGLRVYGISDYLDFDPKTYISEPCENLVYSLMLK
jgi:hypothetical protein